jgi:CheY-like chemotaxis protein
MFCTRMLSPWASAACLLIASPRAARRAPRGAQAGVRDARNSTRRIRADEKHAKLRLIALTGYGRSSDRTHAIAAGFDVHLVKPVQPEKLANMLANGVMPTTDGQL